MNVHYADGRVENFNLGHLIISIAEAFSHQPSDGRSYALALAQTVESYIARELQLVTNEDIEAICHQTLKRFDERAAMQYALKHQLISSVKRRGRPSLA